MTNANRSPDENPWQHSAGNCRASAIVRSGRHGPFLVFTFQRCYPGGRSRAFTARDLECLRPLITHALRFERAWRRREKEPRS